jgi:cyclic pyranopterin phosphate synthase
MHQSPARHLGSGAAEELTLTTSGSPTRASRPSSPIAAWRINIRTGTLDADKFHAITRWGNLSKVGGIDAAQARA